MPFPSSNVVSLQQAWTTVGQIAASVKLAVNNTISQANAGTLDGQQILVLAAWLNSQNTQLTALAATAGLETYAQSQINNPSFDIAGSFATMQAAIAATSQWIAANFPKDSQGYAQFATLDASANTTYTVFTAAALAGFITQLTALSATIQ